MNVRKQDRTRGTAKLLIIAGATVTLAGCSLFPKPEDTAPVLTTVYAPSVGQDVYSSLSPSHFLE
ncbi:hypothetical protein OMP38_22720 [Cohnella ginsengisoli]|uniref:Uncharacterized protein n=1 Tax=Cohnella ginsengisoli TaxID=425004 RepID=A0A9X4KJS7_9BACL|nr:hypothetical protein [Cohnella ginsengisoli]MDG0793343.1 hypothetical protein [Cohnella ginsengisoli]